MGSDFPFPTTSSRIACKNREEWLEVRRTGLGGSDAAAILGESAYKAPFDVWLDKMGERKDEGATSEYAYWGNVLEPIVAAEFSKRSGKELLHEGEGEGKGRVIYRNAEHPFCIASPDRIILPPGSLAVAPLSAFELYEGKTANIFLNEDWEFGPPRAYWIQCQHTMAATGLPNCWIACLVGGNLFKLFEIKRDEAFIKDMLAQEADFWRLVESKTSPKMLGRESEKDTLRVWKMPEPEKTIALSDECVRWDLQKVDSMRIIKEQEARKLQAENSIKLEMGDAGIGTLPDGTRYTLKRQTQPPYMNPGWTANVLKRSEAKAEKPKKKA